MIGSFNDIINIYSAITHAYGVSLKNISSLIMSELATLYVIGIISKIYLHTMIDATFHLALLLLAQYCQQWRHF